MTVDVYRVYKLLLSPEGLSLYFVMQPPPSLSYFIHIFLEEGYLCTYYVIYRYDCILLMCNKEYDIKKKNVFPSVCSQIFRNLEDT